MSKKSKRNPNTNGPAANPPDSEESAEETTTLTPEEIVAAAAQNAPPQQARGLEDVVYDWSVVCRNLADKRNGGLRHSDTIKLIEITVNQHLALLQLRNRGILPPSAVGVSDDGEA